MHNAAFADDAFMRLIWGGVADRASFDRALAKDFSLRRVCVRKGLAPGFPDPVGMTLAFVIDTTGEEEPPAVQEEDEHLSGTDVPLFKEFMAMLERVRAAYRERDSRFYREFGLPISGSDWCSSRQVCSLALGGICGP